MHVMKFLEPCPDPDASHTSKHLTWTFTRDFFFNVKLLRKHPPPGKKTWQKDIFCTFSPIPLLFEGQEDQKKCLLILSNVLSHCATAAFKTLPSDLTDIFSSFSTRRLWRFVVKPLPKAFLISVTSIFMPNCFQYCVSFHFLLLSSVKFCTFEDCTWHFKRCVRFSVSVSVVLIPSWNLKGGWKTTWLVQIAAQINDFNSIFVVFLLKPQTQTSLGLKSLLKRGYMELVDS